MILEKVTWRRERRTENPLEVDMEICLKKTKKYWKKIATKEFTVFTKKFTVTNKKIIEQIENHMKIFENQNGQCIT